MDADVVWEEMVIAKASRADIEKVINESRDHYGQLGHGRFMDQVPGRGVDFCYVDALPRDGNVEIELCRHDSGGFAVKVRAIKRACFVLRADERPDAVTYAAALAEHLRRTYGVKLPAADEMKKHYRDYNPRTAQEILDALPAAWSIYEYEGGLWGPGLVGKCVTIHPTTVGRYLKALRDAGVETWKGVRLP